MINSSDIWHTIRRPLALSLLCATLIGSLSGYGWTARLLGSYARERGVLPLAEAVHRISGRPAARMGLVDRGLLRSGALADVVVFDPRRYAPRATYQQPTELAVGVQTVLVNGVLAVDGGKLTGRAAGRALPHRPPAGTCP